MPSTKASPALYVISPDGRLLMDPEPQTEIMIISQDLELCYALTEAIAFQSWSRGAVPGGQPDPPYGTKAWFKTGSMETNPKEDAGFWQSKDTLFINYRNNAAAGDVEFWDRTEQMLKYTTFATIGLLILSGLYAAAKGLTG